MYQQNNKNLNEQIQKVGCLYLSMMKMVSLIINEDISVEDINKIWDNCKRLSYIKENGYMADLDGVLRTAKMILGHHYVIASIGIIENNKTLFWQWTNKNPEHQQIKYRIENLKTFGKEGNHFILKDKDNKLLFDSYSFHEYMSEYKGRFHLFSYWI